METWVDNRRGSQTSLSAPWVTDAAIAQFLALLTKPSAEQINNVTIYDPCVWFGNTLIYSSTLVNDAIVIGQDVDSNIVGLTSLCLSLKNCDATLSTVDSISGPVPNPPISADVVEGPCFGHDSSSRRRKRCTMGTRQSERVTYKCMGSGCSPTP